LNEIHHRVKNNLQVITSLLNLQAGRARDPAVHALISESRDRVQAMALIHQLLFERRDWSRVQLGPYLHRLGDLLSSTYGRGRIELGVEADDVELDVQRAVPCGLLVNELVTNAFKHAFPGERPGRIDVELRRTAGVVELAVADDGVGHDPAGPATGGGLGHLLVEQLARQLGGSAATEGKGGTRVVVRIPITD
jgi:two-component system, sensor histidine kinase PdtaS